MSKISTDGLIQMIIGFILIAVLLPIGLDSLLNMVLPEGIDPVISTLLTVLLPILAVIGIVMKFLPKGKEVD